MYGESPPPPPSPPPPLPPSLLVLNLSPVQEMVPLSPAELPVTHADISLSQQVLHFSPRVSVEEGLPRFVEWFKDYTHNQSSNEGEKERNRRKSEEILRYHV